MAIPSSISSDLGLWIASKTAALSQDPVCHVGCALVSSNGALEAVGYNHRAQHAECEALSEGVKPGFTAYIWPRPPCAECAKLLIDAGVVWIVCRAPGPRQKQRWGGSYGRAFELLGQAGVGMTMVPCNYELGNAELPQLVT